MTTPRIPPRPLRARAAAGLGAALLLLAACGDDGVAPGVPERITLADSAFTFIALGQNHIFAATAEDGHGDPMVVGLTWSTSDPAILKVNGDGIATAAGVGTATVTASFGALAATAAVTVTQVPAHLEKALGDRQSGPASQPLPTPLTVQVTDALNNRIPGVAVGFATPDPGASVSPDTGTTDFFGEAATTFTLGPADGSYTVVATVPGTALSTTFNLQTGGPFNIEIEFVAGTPTPAQALAFAEAELRWETIIQGDLPDDYAVLPANSCGNNPAIDRPVDDVLIFVTIADIDGPGGILGQAGPCFLHTVGFLPAIGQMTFDAADLADIEVQGLLSPVVIHEMGHVLGYGTLWGGLGLLANPSLSGGIDPSFTGPAALAAFDSIGGSTYVGAKVPVEDQGGPGTADAHWREAVFGNELMTGFVNQGVNPLSVVSVASMADLGYTVDLAAADPFALLFPLRLPGGGVALPLGDDVARGPVRVLPRAGKAGGSRRP